MHEITVSAATAEEYPRGPNGLADMCRDEITKMEAAIPCAPTKAVRQKLERHKRQCEKMERWCKTRAGYVEPEQ